MIENTRKSMLSNLLATFIFFSPNFLLLIPAIRDSRFPFMIYNFVILFLLTCTVSSLRFNVPVEKKDKEIIISKDTPTVEAKYRKI